MQKGGHTYFTADDGIDALVMLKSSPMDLMILDVMMPHLDGFSVCKMAREMSNMPIIMLTAKSAEDDKLKGYDYGADDYMTKPFSPKVLLAKVNALLRRSSATSADTISTGKIMLQPNTHKVYLDGQEITLTHKEYELLSFLMANPGQIFSREQILNRVWGYDFSVPCAVSSADEFGELSISLNTMAENLQQTLARLEDANTQLEQDVEKERRLLAERKELVDSLSHEMKTPLGIIRAYAEGLQDETDEAKKQKYAQVIVSEVERMNDLIVTLLDLSALESGAAHLAITRFDFVELVETVAGRLLVDAPDADFELQYELPEQKVFVQADMKRMEQVLGNLIVNAKKNVHPGCILRLELVECSGMLNFSIFNQGRPIPASDLPKIWTKFYRDSGAEYSGSGLGLSIVAQILSMQRLSYGAENLADGVRFYFSIPITE